MVVDLHAPSPTLAMQRVGSWGKTKTQYENRKTHQNSVGRAG